MIKNKNVRRVLSLGIGLTILSCNDNKKDRIVEVCDNEEGIKEDFIELVRTGTEEELNDLYNPEIIGDEVLEEAFEYGRDEFFRFFFNRVLPGICSDYHSKDKEKYRRGSNWFIFLARYKSWETGKNTLLHWLAEYGSLDAIFGLVDNARLYTTSDLAEFGGFDSIFVSGNFYKSTKEFINIKNQDGNTPLHLAAMNGYCNVVQYLMFLGANENSLNNDGDTPSSLAEKNNHGEIVHYFKIREKNEIALQEEKRKKMEEERKEIEERKKEIFGGM